MTTAPGMPEPGEIGMATASASGVSQETAEDVIAHLDESESVMAAADQAAAKQTPEEDAAYEDSVGEARKRAFGGTTESTDAVDSVNEDIDPIAKRADA